jgi:hypothetical protein
MDVTLLRLPGLKAVQADEQVLAKYDIDLGSLLTAEDGLGVERCEVIGHWRPGRLGHSVAA